MQVMAFLSSRGTPIAHRFEIWQPGEGGAGLQYASGYREKGTDLKTAYEDVVLAKGECLLGITWLTGVPQLLERLETEDSPLTRSARHAELQSLLESRCSTRGYCSRSSFSLCRWRCFGR